ncbi:OprD family outer membrane porin [Pseudomonas sp.]|uniref:OprD family outer membrane porin n=1 Tax=Pseudomonas sp. TaxID=306 RepID=UPI00272D8B3E|nr:OprD family outer membrane porin [Pseudomonas sp.]
MPFTRSTSPALLDSGERTDKVGRTRNPGTVFPLDDDNSAVSNFGRVDFTAKRVSATELRVGMLQPRLPVLTQTKLQSGPLKDLDFSLRHASLRSDVTSQRDIDELRVVVSYSLSLL